MPLKDHSKRAALADKYGWKIMGWAVDLDNPAGITLQSKWGEDRFLRFQHSDSLKKWETELKENKLKKPKNSKAPATPKTFEDVVAENDRLMEAIKAVEPLVANAKYTAALTIIRAALKGFPVNGDG